MNFNRNYLLLVALLAAGCGGGGGGGYDGGGGGNNNPPVTTPPAPAPTGTAFTAFVKTQLAQTSNTSEPTDVNDRQFEFEDNETAFDDVLQ
jgi:hypothetical protein